MLNTTCEKLSPPPVVIVVLLSGCERMSFLTKGVYLTPPPPKKKKTLVLLVKVTVWQKFHQYNQ